MMLKDNFGTIDPIIGCQIPRIIVCLNGEHIQKSSYDSSKLLDHCEKHLKDRYQGCLITVLSAAPKELSLDDFDFNPEKLVIKVDLYNIFNIVNSHYYNSQQVTIEIIAAVKRFDPLTPIIETRTKDLVNEKLSKMMVISNIINDACEINIFKDGESFNCLDLKGNPLIVDALNSPNIVLGYSVFDAYGNILCVIKDNINIVALHEFFILMHTFQNNVESYYSSFLSSKMMSILKGGNITAFTDCNDLEYAKEVCRELLINYRAKLLCVIPIESFSQNNNFDNYFETMFSKSIDYSILDFKSEMQDYFRFRD